LLDLAEACLSLEGYRVELADDGPEGLAMLRTARPDLVLLDLMLPTLPGLEVARGIRADPEFRAVPIVLMSGRTPTPEELALSDAFLSKPFSLTDLVQAVSHQAGG